MKYTSTAAIPEAVADLLEDPVAEDQLLEQILKHRGEKKFTAKVGEKTLSVSTVSPSTETFSLALEDTTP